MKNCLLILVLSLCICFVHADEKKKISIILKDQPVYDLFEELKAKAGLQIVYSKEMLTIAGKPVTINIELNDTSAGLILEVASRAAGFTFEKKESIYIILPVITLYTAAAPAVTTPPEKAPSEKTETEPEKKEPPVSKGSGSVEVVGEAPASKELTRKRYTGNFMFGHADKVYLNLVIPLVNGKEEDRITREFKRSLKDGLVSKNEAEKLFGHGTEISGKDMDNFLKVLYKKSLEKISDDGKLTTQEINELRNDFINTILESYEGQ